MIRVKFFHADGNMTELDLDEGISLMEGAVRNGIDGIDADCGGQLSCATCHVHVGKSWLGRLTRVSDDEKDLLEFAADVDGYSRLSCQITLAPELDGLEVHVPRSQS